MPTGYQNEFGVDFEDLFEPGDVPADGYRLADDTLVRFAARGSAPKGPDVGYQDVNGVDLSNIWLPKGAVPPILGFDGKNYFAGAARAAAVELRFNPNGTWSVVRIQQGTTTTLDSGVWLPPGQVAAGYEIRFTITGATGEGIGVSNNATTFVSAATGRTAAVSAASINDGPAAAEGNMVCDLRRVSGTPSTSTLSYSVAVQGV